MNILVVDDDRPLCRSIELQLRQKNYTVLSAHDIAGAIAVIDEFSPNTILLDINLPDENGIAAMPKFLDFCPSAIIIIMTAETDNKAAVDSMRTGAFDYLRKPFDLQTMFDLLAKAETQLQTRNCKSPQVKVSSKSVEMIGFHSSIIDVHKTIGLLSRSRVNVLIQGESGTGKELAARILHESSSPGHPFVAINCSAVVSTLLESEFFGHEKGAFTGADSIKIGQFEFAGQGTIFLDEIGDMPLDLQAKLLRVLQEEEFVRVGGLKPIPLKARIVGATHQDLPTLVNQGRFRNDLYYRLTVSSILLPPLRKRPSDIPELVRHLLHKICQKLRCDLKIVDPQAMQRLTAYDWPGNVRELENTLTRSVALSHGSLISECALRFSNDIRRHRGVGEEAPVSLAEAEKKHIEKILARSKWNITRASKMLEVSPTTLRKKISDFKLDPIKATN